MYYLSCISNTNSQDNDKGQFTFISILRIFPIDAAQKLISIFLKLSREPETFKIMPQSIKCIIVVQLCFSGEGNPKIPLSCMAPLTRRAFNDHSKQRRAYASFSTFVYPEFSVSMKLGQNFPHEHRLS